MTTQTVAVQRTHQDHATLLSRMDPNVAGWRGCAGIALLLDGDVSPPDGQAGGDQGFVKNDALTWITAVDVPVPWMTGLSRTAHLIQRRRASFRYGSPILDAAGVQGEWDYWDGPTKDMPEEVARAADGLNNAMTSTAFAFRSSWQAYAGMARSYVGSPGVVLGDKVYEPGIVKDFSWVPKPWVGVDPAKAATMYSRLKENDYNDTFRAVAIDLFVVGMPVLSPVEGVFTGTSPLVVNGVRYTQFNFREKKNGARQSVVATAGATVSSAKGMPVSRGTRVGSDSPPAHRAFYEWPRARQWNELVRAYRPEVLDLVLGNVFSNLFRQVEGKTWLLPFAVLGQDVSYSLGTGDLWWDVTPIHGEDRDFSLGADPRIHIMPTMRMGQWDSFKDHLGHTAVDLSPVDPRFRSYALGRQIRRKYPMTADGYTGDGQGEVVPVAVVPGRPRGVLPDLGDAETAERTAAAPTREEWEADRRRKWEAAGVHPGRPDDGTDDKYLAGVRRSKFFDRIAVENPTPLTLQAGRVLNTPAPAEAEVVVLEHGVPEEEAAEERWEDDGGPAPGAGNEVLAE